ncbi:MAG: FAD-binding oxidoreductase [Thermomicrobiales bacterium]|nr:FAD-binding oxidoreductase [Thermomicrobiales bacterium]
MNTTTSTYPSSVSVVVVGGGVAGTAAAWQLARRGIDVALFEQEHLAWGATGRNGGQTGVEANYGSGIVEHRLRSLEILREAERELGEFEYDQCGRLRLWLGAPGERDLPTPEQFAATDHPLGDKYLTGDQARDLLPLLSDEVLAARWVPTSGRLWPFKLVHRFAEGATRHGARIFTGATVERLVIADGRVQGVVVDGQTVRAEWVVNATNAWSGPLAATAGLNLPVMPWRGQIVVTEPLPPMLNFTMGHFVYNSSNYWQQTRDGKFVIGGSRVLDTVGRDNLHDRSVTPDILHKTLAMLVTALPSLRGARIVRAWGGTMGFTPDGNPYIGETELRRGLLLTCGFSGSGLSWAPVAGEILAQIVAREPMTLSLDPIHPDRATGNLVESSAA